LIFASEYPRITNRLIRIATLTVAGGPYIALAVGSAASAGATPTPAPTASAGAAPLAAAQAKAKVAITARLAWLNTTIPAVTANMLITAADRATLLATLNSHATELTALGQKISADTRPTTSRSSPAYRVYALALTRVHYAAAVDDITSSPRASYRS
jgi:hypothetical protein